MLFHAKESTIQVSGSRMTYVSFGSGSAPLVMIPGLSLRSIHGSALPLAWMFRILSRDHKVYVLDKREAVPEGCRIVDLANDAAEAMHQLGIGRADVIGISLGGMIAQQLALDHPGIVRHLVLGVTLSRPNDTLRAVIGKWVRDASDGDLRAIVPDMMKKMYSDRYLRKYRWLFPIALKTAKLDDPERFIRLAKACLTCDTYDRLDQLRCPVLVLGGADDRIVTAKASEEIADRIGCQIHMYEGLGHAAYEEAGDFDRRIFDFLKNDPA
ncbi:MAG: alpha/beta hydrolase [Clostridia bacterium]|nr:alpha/beta hydrolase [Clostridia bacterium]